MTRIATVLSFCVLAGCSPVTGKYDEQLRHENQIRLQARTATLDANSVADFGSLWKNHEYSNAFGYGDTWATMVHDEFRWWYCNKMTLSQETLDAVTDGRVIIGMNQLDCLVSWGRPNEINRTVTSQGTDEQWVYVKGRLQFRAHYVHGTTQYLYFENGVLTAFQD